MRQHYYSSDILRHGCRHADVLKLNEEELEMVLSALDIAPTESAIESCRQILHHTPIQYVVYTQGPLGTTIITHSGVFYGKPHTLTNSQDSEPADSVGAGDACTAGIVAGLLLSKPLRKRWNWRIVSELMLHQNLARHQRYLPRSCSSNQSQPTTAVIKVKAPTGFRIFLVANQHRNIGEILLK